MKNFSPKLNPTPNLLATAVVLYIMVFIATRFVNIISVPPSIDEVRHILRAQSTANGDLFIGMRESLKQFYIWIIAVFLPLSRDHVLTARVVSTASGLLGAGVCYKLTRVLYPDRQIGYIAALFYLLSPFTLFYDRMALTDSLLTTLVGISILSSIHLWRYPTVRGALFLGIILGIATLTKTYAVLFYSTPMLLWLVWGKEISWGRVAKLMMIIISVTSFAWLPIFIIGQAAYKQDHYQKLITASTEFTSFGIFWYYNSLLAVNWLSTYLTWPIIGLLIVSFLTIIAKRDKIGMVLIILVMEPILIFTVFFAIWYPRYLLPVIVIISVLFAYGIDQLTKFALIVMERITGKDVHSYVSPLALQTALFLIFCISFLTFDYKILTVPSSAPIPATDKRQYFEGSGAGYGLRESIQVIKMMANQYPKVNLIREPSTLRYVLTDFYLSNTESLSFIDIPGFYAITSQRLDSYAKEAPTLTVITTDKSRTHGDLAFFTGSEYPQAWRVASFLKPGGYQKVEIYQWLLPPDFAIRWFQQGGDAEPRVAWQASDTLVTAPRGELIDWPLSASSTAEVLEGSLEAANIEYVLATPDLINHQSNFFEQYMTTDGAHIKLEQLPPGWRLAFVYPDINCQWCLFQLRPPDNPTQIIFEEGIELEGYDISVARPSSEQYIYITLYWKSIGSVSESYTVFIHLLDSNSNLLHQVDELPLQGKWPTNNWKVGNRLVDRHTLIVDSEPQSGNYTISIGLYDSTNLKRMPAYSSQHLIKDDAVTITSLSVKEKILIDSQEKPQLISIDFKDTR